MSTSYLVSAEITITRMEGDTGSIVFTIPATFDPANYTVKFQMRNDSNTLLIDKSTGSGITAVLQVVTVALAAVDTTDRDGTNRWELQLSDGTDIITIGNGPMIIRKETVV